MTMAAGLYHELHGPLGAPPLVLCSGLGGSAGDWAANLPALARDRRVLVYDQRGTGRSDPVLPAACTVAEMAADLAGLLDALEIGRASVVGHGAGGAIGLALALTAPERLETLVLVNAWAAPDPHLARCFDMRAALLRDSGARAYVRARPLFLYPADYGSDHAARLDAEEDAAVAALPPAAVMEARVAAIRAFDVTLALGTITVPTMALAAADDMMVPSACSQRLAAAIPGATLRTMAWGGHACNVTDPRTFDALVREFLDGGTV